MNQVIPAWLAIIFIFIFAFGVGFFLLKFNDRVSSEMAQSSLDYRHMINDQSLELRKNLNDRKALTNMKK